MYLLNNNVNVHKMFQPSDYAAAYRTAASSTASLTMANATLPPRQRDVGQKLLQLSFVDRFTVNHPVVQDAENVDAVGTPIESMCPKHKVLRGKYRPTMASSLRREMLSLVRRAEDTWQATGDRVCVEVFNHALNIIELEQDTYLL